MGIRLILLTVLTLGGAVATAAPASATQTLKDGLGRVVAIASPPQRILSGSLASDEIALTLLTRAGQTSRLIAVSTFADDPLYSNVAGKIPPSIKARFGQDLESALALKPDLAVLASFNKPETLARFKEAHVTTFVLGGFANFEDIDQHVAELGQLFGLQKEADALRAEFRAVRAHAATRAKTALKKPAVLSFHASGTLAAGGTLFDALVTAAGGENLAAIQGLKGWPQVSSEIIAGFKPNVIVAAGDEKDRAAINAQILAAPGWRSMPAAKTAKLILIPERELDATSPYVAGALEKLNKEMFPTSVSIPKQVPGTLP